MAKDVAEIGLPVGSRINGDVHIGQPARREKARRLKWKPEVKQTTENHIFSQEIEVKIGRGLDYKGNFSFSVLLATLLFVVF